MKSVKQFLSLSLASVSSLVHFQMHKSRGITFGKTLGDVEAKTFVIRIITFFFFLTGRISGPPRAEAGGMEKKPLLVPSLFPVCLELLKVVPARW